MMHKKLIYYLAGPMSGVPETNYPLFKRVTAELRAQGLTVINPGENFEGKREGIARAAFLRTDWHNILYHANALIFLPGWEGSAGATSEFTLGRELGYPLFLWHEGNQPTACLRQMDPKGYPPVKMDRLTRAGL